MEYIFLLFVFLSNMEQDCPIQINVINKIGKKSSKSSQSILPKMCNVMDYFTNYSFCN